MLDGSAAVPKLGFGIVHWNRRGPLARLLLPLAWLFGAVLRVRGALYRSGWLRAERVGVPVVVIGNFVVGGTGKTPLTIALARALRDAGRRPGIVSRGHGGSEAGPVEVPHDGDPARFGDEPVLLAAKSGAPVWIGRDRARAAHALRRAHPDVDVVLCDDGLQHLRLARDFEIALIDARGVGNGWLLPAGPLRERPRAVDAIVRNGAPPARRGEFVMDVALARCYSLAMPDEDVPLERLRAARVRAVAGIGAPQRFFALLERLGLRVEGVALPDHHRFVAADLALHGADYLLITEKDAVKCARLDASIARDRIVVVAIDASIEATLVQCVLERIGGLAPA